MGVTFILGRTASGRDERVIKKITDIAKQDPLAEVLVIVPPQSTYITEKQLLRAMGAKGMMGVCVQSPSRVCDRVLESTYGRAVTSIDAVGKSMLLRLILDRDREELRALAKSAVRSELPFDVASLISELKTLDITPDMLREVCTENANTRDKLQDIAFLYERLEEETQYCFDTEDKINLVIEHINEADFLKNTQLVIHGFDIYNAQTVRFFTALMCAAKDSVMSFYYAASKEADSEVYGICDENRNKFLASAAKLGLHTEIVTEDRKISQDILHIEKNLYAYPLKQKERARDVSIMRAKSMEEEVRAVMAQIVWLNKKHGYAFHDMAVVCGSAQKYVPMITRRFEEAGIPCFAGKGRTLDSCAYSVFLLGAIELSQGRLKKDTLIAHAKTGFCGIPARGISALQNYAFSNVRDGFAFTHPFKDEAAERARAALMEPIMRLRARAKNALKASEYIDCVLEYASGLAAADTLSAQMRAAEAAGLAESAEFTAQVYDKAMRILQQAQEILRDAPIKKAEFKALIKTGLASQKVEVLPPMADEIAVGEISYVRLDDVKAVFVLGANDGVLPNYEQTSDILADYERELLLTQLAGLTYTGNVEKQKLAILKTFTKPEEKLFVSYVENDEEKRSLLIDRLYELFADIKQTEAADIAPMLKQNAYMQTARSLRAYGNGVEQSAEERVAAAVLADREFPQKLRAILWGTQNANAARRLKEETAAKLYGKMHGSASRIEKYYECPYKHFIAYGLRVRAPREYTVDQMDVGNYAHKILETMTKEVKKTGKKWAELPQEELDKCFATGADAARKEQEKYTLNKHNDNVLSAVERETRLAASAVCMQLSKSALQPRESEYTFEKEISEGIVLHGKIDRIDTAELNGCTYFDIIDYKTGQPRFSMSELAGGLSLQLMIYIMAVQEILSEKATFAGAHYFEIHLPIFDKPGKAGEQDFDMKGICGVDFETAQELFGGEENAVLTIALKYKNNGEPYEATRKKMFTEQEVGELLGLATELIRHAVCEIKGGDTRIMPYSANDNDKKGCDYCDFAGVCMYDEGYAGNEQRIIPDMTREDVLAEARNMKAQAEAQGEAD
ncbi:MAG: PD-(D/E)XK nuclease family protein [Christensenella sp.]